MLAVAFISAGGCTAPATPAISRTANLLCPVGVWYAVEPLIVADPDGADARIKADLTIMRRLGVDTIFVQHAAADRWETLAGLAESVQLRPVRSTAGLRFAAPVEDVIGPSQAEHQGKLELQAGRPILDLRCEADADEDPLATDRRWWRRFHAGLAQGLTGGLAIGPFRGLPGNEHALAAADGSIGVERLAAVKRMAARMRAWGPMLDRLELRPAPELDLTDGGPRLTLFAEGPRRLLLMVNPSATEVLRSTVALHAEINGLPVDRLVEVPAESGLELGTMARFNGERIKLALEIGPGDARLFEVFGPVADKVEQENP